MDIDYRAAGFWFQLGQALITAAVFLYVWVTNRHKANASSIDDLSTDLGEMDDRLIRIEKDVEHMPTHRDMEKLYNRFNDTAQRLKEVEGQLKQINNTMQLMHKHLLNGVNK